MQGLSAKGYDFVQVLTEDPDEASTTYLVKIRVTQRMRVARVYSIDGLEQDEVNRALREIRILASIYHPNILMYYDAFVDLAEGNLIIVTEYCEKKSLKHVLRHICDESFQEIENVVLKEERVSDYLIQIVMGLKELRRFGINHRNLKPSNLFLNSDGILKIGDFTFSKFETSGKMMTQIGTPQYAAPEVYKQEPYTYKSDIWSLGVVLFELTFGELPFPDTGDFFESQEMVLKRKFKFPIVQKGAVDNIRFIINWCLDLEPDKRPDFDTLIKQPFLKELLKEYMLDFPSVASKEKQILTQSLLMDIKYTIGTSTLQSLDQDLVLLREQRQQTFWNGTDVRQQEPIGRAPRKVIEVLPIQTNPVKAEAGFAPNDFGPVPNEIRKFGNSRFMWLSDMRTEYTKQSKEPLNPNKREELGMDPSAKQVAQIMALQGQGKTYGTKAEQVRWKQPYFE